MAHHEATSRDWLHILGLGGVVLAIGIVLGAVGATLKHTSFRPPASLVHAPDLIGDYIEIAVIEPAWEAQVLSVLPPRTSDTEQELLIVATDSTSTLRWLVARIDASVPPNIHLFLVNITVVSRDTITAEYVGEVTGHFYIFNTTHSCWVEIPHTSHADITPSCIQ